MRDASGSPPPADGGPIVADPLAAARLLPMLLALMAVAVPLLLAGSVPPTSTFFNQVWSFGAWGVAMAVCAFQAGLHRRGGALVAEGPVDPRLNLPLLATAVALALLIGAYAVSPAPFGQRAAPMLALAMGLGTAALAARSARGAAHAQALPLLMLALLAAGVLSSGVGLIQVFWPSLADGAVIALPTTPGRAVGNVRQPNQLSTLLLWASAAAVYLGVQSRWPTHFLAGLLALLVFGTCLTASRTGLVGVVLLAAWGLLDRRLPRPVRGLLLACLPFYALAWWGVSAWGAASGHTFFGEAQITRTLHGDASSSRLGVWRNTLAMIAAHPWTGVGFGRFNFVWTFTPFPDRPVAFFDHSHNLLLELAAEGGVPLAVAVLALLGWAMWRARGGLVDADDGRARAARTALFMLVVVGVHSQLEYPLWYAYFLLPAAALLGWYLGLGQPGGASGQGVDAPAPPPRGESAGARVRDGVVLAAIALLGVLAIGAAVQATREYRSVAVIFEPSLDGPQAAPLDERIAAGRQSRLFGQHADYALVTLAEKPETVFDGFERPLYHLVDSRLMMAYAKALAARGQQREASHVAARLREFRNPASHAFFAVCEAQPDAFQCRPDPRLKASDMPLR